MRKESGLALLFLLPHLITPVVADAAVPPEQFIEEAKKSVVRIGALYTATVRAPKPIYNEQTDDYDPGSPIVERDVATIALGSGFIVDSSGYVITNAHVVDTSTETVSDYIWRQYLADVYDDLYQSLSADAEQTTIDAIYNKLTAFVSRYGSIENLEYKISVFNPNQTEGTLTEFVEKGYLADIRKIGEPYPKIGKDIAVLKIEATGFDPLPLGSSIRIREGSKVYPIGFPGVADLNDRGTTQATVTEGIVSSIKKSSQGDYNVIQIDAAISGGNSGGPVFNDNGDVIGIATFKAYEEQGYNWILPVELAKQYLQELNVQYQESSSERWTNRIKSLSVKTLLISNSILFILLCVFVAIFLKARRKKTLIVSSESGN